MPLKVSVGGAEFEPGTNRLEAGFGRALEADEVIATEAGEASPTAIDLEGVKGNLELNTSDEEPEGVEGVPGKNPALLTVMT